jgi:hypothetical protein
MIRSQTNESNVHKLCDSAPLTTMATGVFLMMSLLLGRPGPKVHCSVLAVSTANLLAPGVASAIGTFTS